MTFAQEPRRASRIAGVNTCQALRAGEAAARGAVIACVTREPPDAGRARVATAMPGGR